MERTSVPELPGQESKTEIHKELHNKGKGIDYLGREQEEQEIEEVEDYDVEKVLKNQNTHDLYCPECKIRITKTVILEKIQRTPPQELKDAKRKKWSDLDEASLHSEDEPSLHSEDNISSTDSDHPVPQSFLFKCLSCFKIFSSTGTKTRFCNYFVQPNPQENPTGNSCWFCSIFGFNKHGSDAPKGRRLEPEKPIPRKVGLEILKSIVYGGLIESLTSLGVISSAAGSGASTLNILVLGLANLFGGLILIIHKLQELREEEPVRAEDDETNDEEVESRYKRLLGRRKNFGVHATVAILSFIIMGLLPPVVYYFSFSETHNRDYKVASVFGSSLLCIVLLAIAKAHVEKPRAERDYLKSVMYYATNAVSVSGITYVVGNIVNQLLDKYGWDDGPAGGMMLWSLMGRKAGIFVVVKLNPSS